MLIKSLCVRDHVYSFSVPTGTPQRLPHRLTLTDERHLTLIYDVQPVTRRPSPSPWILPCANKHRKKQRRLSSSLRASDIDIIPIEEETGYTTSSSECLHGEACTLDHHENQKDTDGEDIFYLDSIYTDSSLVNPSLLGVGIKPSSVIMILPIITPFLAYMTYDDTARGFAYLFDLLAKERNWVPVDGGTYQAKIIAPAINGIVVPAISILFAILTGNTVTTLRQRQIDIHTFLNCEAGDLRLLSSMVDCYPQSNMKDKCREYLTQYTCRLIAESSSKPQFGSTDSEMNGFVSTLNDLACITDEKVNGKYINDSPPATVLSESYGAVVRLNNLRSSRITALQSTFPVLHYGILLLLAGSICVAFLLETNQELLIFLNAIQLRILWTMLIGSISALGVVCYDLSGPFRGSYQISNAVTQLRSIRDTMRAVTNDATDLNE